MKKSSILRIYKPPGKSSQQVLGHWKKKFPRGTKIGHFGTLDPFASGLLLIGIDRATRLNDLVHHFLPKTYLAVGKLAVATASGDHTSPIIATDQREEVRRQLGALSRLEIQQLFQSHFLGQYWQVPPAYSACKFAGKALHRWAREDGIIIQKDPVARTIYSLEVVKYCFPYLSLRVSASSGTYLRTLFTDGAQLLGTCGHLLGLVREQIGQCHFRQQGPIDPWALLPFGEGILPGHRLRAYHCGLSTAQTVVERAKEGSLAGPYLWLRAPDGPMLGLAKDNGAGQWQTVITFGPGPVHDIPS